MKRTCLISLIAVLLVFCCVLACAQNASGKFKLTVFRGDKVLAACLFTGADKNGDGILEAAELTAFKETEDYTVSETTRTSGFAAYADLKKLPMLEHGLEDVQTFRLDLAEFKKGKTALQYKTYTKRDFTFGKYVFWRIVQIKEDGKTSFFHGVGDGTKGLQLSMLDSASLRFQVTAE